MQREISRLIRLNRAEYDAQRLAAESDSRAWADWARLRLIAAAQREQALFGGARGMGKPVAVMAALKKSLKPAKAGNENTR